MKRSKSTRNSFMCLLSIFLVFAITSNAQKVNDKDTFKTIKIDNQVWMLENLDVANFRNGDPIPEAKTDEDWVTPVSKINRHGVTIKTILTLEPNMESYIIGLR